jgi:uncharacterized protein YodC (DUF2158 family)
MENKLNVGDTVRLLSGGPLMTINEVNIENNTADCIWFNMDENLCSATFKNSVIELDDDFDFEDDEDWNEVFDDEDLDDEDLDLDDDEEEELTK